MNIYTPYITLVIGIFAGWTLKLFLLKHSERRDDLNKIREDYLRLTENEPASNILAFRMKSLEKAGALRLGKSDFEKLLSDISKHNKEVVLVGPLARAFSVRACLEIAHEHKLDLAKPTSIHRWILGEIDGLRYQSESEL